MYTKEIFSMDTLIQKCHARHQETRTQQQTAVLSAGYEEYPYHYRVHYAQEHATLLYAFEQAAISVLPIGKAPFDRAPADWLRKDPYRNRVDERQEAQGWMPRQWFASWGIGIYTGLTSAQGAANWHDILFTYQAILEAPTATRACLDALINTVKDPLVVLTQDGDLRFTCRIPDYLHPNTVSDKLYIRKHPPTQPDPMESGDVYVIIKGDKDYSVWDARHEILMGSVFNPPLISSDVLFALLRSFSGRLRCPVWRSPDRRRVHTPKALATKDVVKPFAVDEKAVPVSEQLRDIRADRLSPLAIQRPAPVLAKQPLTAPAHISEIRNSDADVIGIRTGMRSQPEFREIERAFADGREPLFLSLPGPEHCKSAAAYHQTDVSIIGHRTRQPLWDPVWHASVDSQFRGQDRICILHMLYPSKFFTKSELTRDFIKDWIQQWQGSVLGDFGYAICNALEVNESDKTDNIVTRLRAIVKAFEPVKATLIAQLQQTTVSASGDAIGMHLKDAATAGYTYWHQLKRFFDHYRHDTDAPMYFDGACLRFWLPPLMHPRAKKFVVLSPSIDADILRRAFPDKKVKVYDYGTQVGLAGHRVYQLRSEVHSPHSLLNYDLDWDALSLSAVGIRYTTGIHHTVRQTPETQHTIVSTDDMDTALSETLSENNARYMRFHAGTFHYKDKAPGLLEDTDVVWVLGTPYCQPITLWRCAQILYGDLSAPLEYTVSMHPYRFKDPRIQRLSEEYSRQVLVSMLAHTIPSESTGKTLVIQTALWLTDITDAPETRLFDWEDFEIAGGLQRLDTVIERREQHEAEAAKIDKTWLPYQVMPVLGVDYKTAERLLIEVYGREKFVRTTEEVVGVFREKGDAMGLKEIHNILAHRSYSSVEQSVKQLIRDGVVVKVKRGLYGLKDFYKYYCFF